MLDVCAVELKPSVKLWGKLFYLVFRFDSRDAVLPLEVLQVLFRADQHDLGKMTVLLALEAGDLFTGAYRAAYHRVVGFGRKRRLVKIAV